MKLSIVIVSWNTNKILNNCLDSIKKYPPNLDHEIWVVDNASTDGSVQMVEENFPAVKLIRNDRNVGFAPANNQAIAQAQGEYLLLLNSDTIVRPGALQTLVRFMDANPKAGGAGSLLLNPDDSLQTSCYPAPTLAREFWRLFHLDRLRTYGVYDMGSWQLKETREVEVVQGACLILRRSAVDAVGPLDTDYFMYTEEVDLCYRLRKSDWPLYWIPQAEVIHLGGQSTRMVAGEMFLQLYRSKVQFFRKNHGRFSALVYKVILSLSALARILASPLAWFEPPSQRKSHLSLANNYQQLLLKLPGM